MNIGIIGARGFLGTALRAELEQAGHTWIGYTRANLRHQPENETWKHGQQSRDFAGLDALINLAGEPVAQRWTSKIREKLGTSRVEQTAALVEMLQELPPEERPKTLINASGAGYYGHHNGPEELVESTPAGTSFLAELCQAWESAANRAQDLGLRVVTLRTSLVLGQNGQAWERLRTVTKLGIAGPIGHGQQFWPWIHLADWTGAVHHILDTPSLQGPANLCAPQSVTNQEFMDALGQALHRPTILPVPSFAARLALGEFAEELLASMNAQPQALLDSGYQFRFPTLETCFQDLLSECPFSPQGETRR